MSARLKLIFLSKARTLKILRQQNEYCIILVYVLLADNFPGRFFQFLRPIFLYPHPLIFLHINRCYFLRFLFFSRFKMLKHLFICNATNPNI